MITALRGLGGVGRDILAFAGNAGDADWLEHVVAQGEARLGPITGALHTSAMGEAFHAPLGSGQSDALTRLIRQKARSLRALEQVLASRRAQFCLVQSSLSVLVGGHGFGAYAAINAWLDCATARARRQGPTHWQAVNWDIAETGSLGSAAHRLSQHRLLSPDEVWQISAAALAHPEAAQLVVTPGDLATRMRAAAAPLPTAPQRTAPERPAYVAPSDAYETAVVTVMAEMLGVERIGVTENFFELGGHSLLAIQIINRLRRRFEVDLPVRAILVEAPTAAGIAAVIRQAKQTAEAEADTLEALLDGLEAETQPVTG